MPTLWFVIVALMVVVYVILDGFDLGVGIVHWGVGRTEDERSVNIKAIGPVWDGNEVWLLAAGGTLYFAFPPLYAAGFSGFYLPLMMVLWCLMLRGVSVEFRNHIHDSVWRTFFDGVFTFASALLAIFFGAALGNVIRGVPLNEEGFFFTPLFTDFRTGPEPGVLDWYTVLTGVVSLVALAFHGAVYLALKTDGQQNHKAKRVASGSWWVLLALTLLGVPATLSVRPQLLDNYKNHPWLFVVPALVFAGLIAARHFLRFDEKKAFLASCAYLLGMVGFPVFGLYPVILPASNVPERSLTIHNAAGPAYGLQVGVIWWAIGCVLAIFYFRHLYAVFKGKVSAESAVYGH
ncbi:MAG: cytochrome d ubiquinol oxidase subunit II [Acidobacteriales bacterium]|nr:cytochrome d ubiquinol oxidase subunit II [Terriglobales bacterium]